MAPLEYLALAAGDWPLYVALLAGFGPVAWALLIRRAAVSVFDPLFMTLVAQVFGWAIVWFMYLRGDIATGHVVTFTAAQIAYAAGLLVARRGPLGMPAPQPVHERDGVPRIVLATATVLNIASTLAIWGAAGIPLFRESRLGAFAGSGGLGILERIADSTGMIALFCIVYVLLRQPRARRSLPMAATIAWYLTALALSGAKGALLSIAQAVFSTLLLYGALGRGPGSFWGGRAGRWALGVATVFAVGVLAVQQAEGGTAAAALGLVYRIVSYGDVYIFAYPDDTIAQLRGDNPLIGMFGGLLATFRLFPQELVYPNLGYQFTTIVFPDLDLIVGPNPQHPVFGHHYFGMFAFVFSFVLGVITARAQVRLFGRSHGTFVGALVSFLWYFVMANIAADFDYAMSRLASMLIGLVLVMAPLMVLRPNAAILRLPRPAQRLPSRGAAA